MKTPDFGTVCTTAGGLKAGDRKTYDVTITRTFGTDNAIRHELHSKNNAGDTFRIVG